MYCVQLKKYVLWTNVRVGLSSDKVSKGLPVNVWEFVCVVNYLVIKCQWLIVAWWNNTRLNVCTPSGISRNFLIFYISLVLYKCTGWSAKQARNQLGTPGGRRDFWEGPNRFELCPIVLNYVQHIFPGGGKKFSWGCFAPLRPAWLRGGAQ